jgi:hypothetical protein
VRREVAQRRFCLADALLDQQFDHPGVHHRPTSGDLAQCVQQIVEFPGAGLEQVAEAVRATSTSLDLSRG